MNDLSHVPDQFIEEALTQRPYASLPAGFVERVMTEVQNPQLSITREVIHFKLGFFDLVAPMLATCLLVLALGLSGQFAFLNMEIPVQWLAVFPATNLSPPIEWAISNWMLLVGLFLLAEIGLGMLFCNWLWLDEPLSFGEM